MIPEEKSISSIARFAISPERNPILVASQRIAIFLLPVSVTVSTCCSKVLFHLWYIRRYQLHSLRTWNYFSIIPIRPAAFFKKT